MELVIVNGVALEVQRLAATGNAAVAPIIFLHEGLGSVAMWRDWPARVCAATGRGGVVYSRRGYGQSETVPDVRGMGRLQPDYMHREALEVLPALLDELGISSPVLLGHSDGGSIALLYAAHAGLTDVMPDSIRHPGIHGLRVEPAMTATDVMPDSIRHPGVHGLRVEPAMTATDVMPDSIRHPGVHGLRVEPAMTARNEARVPSACIVMAPHVVVEDISLRSIEQAKIAFESQGLRDRLAKFHRDVDVAFWQWNDIWLSEGFRSFDIRPDCRRITAPMLAMQGKDDVYGTLRQIEEIAPTRGEFRKVVLEACGHSPHRDQPERTLSLITEFLAPLP